MADAEFPPLIGWKSLLKGGLGASLLIGSLANNFGIIIQAILFVFGLFMLMDGLMVNGKQGVFIVICLIAAVVFGSITLVLSVAGLGAPYILIVFLISLFLYYETILRPARRMFGEKKKPHEYQAQHEPQA